MRKNYLDNIRIFCIYILIPFHLMMAFNCWGEVNYVFFVPNRFVSSINMMFSPWFMPILFTIAGISARHSLEKRTLSHFIAERIKKIFIPLVSGILLICPFMAYTADKFHNGYAGSYLEHYKVFFSKVTDFTGYDGFFTPGHLWFLLYLFVISIFALIVVMLQKRFWPDFSLKNIKMIFIVFLEIPVFLFNDILNFGGKSIGQNFILFLLGYYVFYEDSVIEKLKTHKIWTLPLGLVFTIVNFIMYLWITNSNGEINFIVSKLACWFMQLGLLGFFAQFFNRTNRITKYLSANSFLFYEFHFVWLLVFQILFANLTGEYLVSSIITVCLSYICTFLNIEIVKRTPFIGALFGVKK